MKKQIYYFAIYLDPFSKMITLHRRKCPYIRRRKVKNQPILKIYENSKKERIFSSIERILNDYEATVWIFLFSSNPLRAILLRENFLKTLKEKFSRFRVRKCSHCMQKYKFQLLVKK